MSGAGTLPPLFVITNNDHGGYICVVLYTLLLLMLGTVAARLFSRWYIVREIRPDDVLLALAMVLGIAQSVFVQMAVNHGLGRKRNIVSEHEFDLYEKCEYIAQILMVATIVCGKTSIALLVKTLMAEKHATIACQALIAVIVALGFASIMALAFRCSLPHPWHFAGSCVDQGALYRSIATFNIVTDVALIVLPCAVFWRVQVSTAKRWRIMSLFATRFVVCAASAVQIYYFEILVHSSDVTWNSITSSMWEQVVMNLSLIATAIPSLGRLIVELQPNINAFAITEHHGTRTSDKYSPSSFASRIPQDNTLEHDIGIHRSMRDTGRRQSSRSDSESMQGLRQNMIQQTLDFRIS